MREVRVQLPLEGGCQCGTCRYAVHQPPLTLYCCHCTECQAQTSSAFGMSMLVRRSALTTDWDRLGIWSRRGTDSGNRMNCHFCPACGVRLFHVGENDPDIVSIKAGSLDDRRVLQPIGHLWTGSAQPWFRAPDDSVVSTGQPDDMSACIERWRTVTADWFVEAG